MFIPRGASRPRTIYRVVNLAQPEWQAYFGVPVELQDIGPIVQDALDWIAENAGTVNFIGGTLILPRGRYLSSVTWVVNAPTYIMGGGTGEDYPGTNIRWTGGIQTGIRIMEAVSGQSRGRGTIIERIRLVGGETNYGRGGTPPPVKPSTGVAYVNWDPMWQGDVDGATAVEGQGIEVRDRCDIVNCTVMYFAYDGIHVPSNDGSVNCNMVEVNRCLVQNNGRHGVFLRGSNSNAGVTVNCSFVLNRRVGLYDSSQHGNLHLGHHGLFNGWRNYVLGVEAEEGGGYVGRAVGVGLYSESESYDFVNGPIFNWCNGTAMVINPTADFGIGSTQAVGSSGQMLGIFGRVTGREITNCDVTANLYWVHRAYTRPSGGGYPLISTSSDFAQGIYADLSTGPAQITIPYPVASGYNGFPWTVKRQDIRRHVLQVNPPSGSTTVHGVLPNVLVAAGETVSLRCDGSRWNVEGRWPPEVFCDDAFTAADGTAVNNRVPDRGPGTWADGLGTWTVTGNAARSDGTADSHCSIDVGYYDLRVRLVCTIENAAEKQGLVLGWVDSQNYTRCTWDSSGGGTARITEVIAGVATDIASVTGVAWSGSQTFFAQRRGATVWFSNSSDFTGTTVRTNKATAHVGVCHHGLFAGASTAFRADSVIFSQVSVR